MAEIKFPDESTYYVANSMDGKIVHYGITDPNQVTTTGQPIFNTFKTKLACETKLKVDLKITDVLLTENPLPDRKITKWGDKVVYKIGDIVLFKDSVYICLKAHTATKDLYPDVSKILWKLYDEKTNVEIIKS
jgi:hypothetical protein